MAEEISLQNQAHGWFYMLMGWIVRWQFKRKNQVENFFLIH
jgi:hypothetical protein